MLRKIGFTFLCASSVLKHSHLFYDKPSLQPGMTIEYDLPQMILKYLLIICSGQ